jgi:hypothetical protein
VGQRRAPRLVVGVGQAGHQPRLDPTAVTDDQGGGPIRHGLHDARPDAPVGLGHSRDPARACEQLGVGAVGSRPTPLLVVLDLARHVARWQLDGVVTAKPMATAVSMARGDALVTTYAKGPSDSPILRASATPCAETCDPGRGTCPSW